MKEWIDIVVLIKRAPSDSGWASSKTELPLDNLVLSTRKKESKNQRSGEKLLPGLVPK